MVSNSSSFCVMQVPCYQRLILALVGSMLVILLITAACLQPNSRGFGTHQGLGLPPCAAIQMFGKPCPSCGMTTSWSHTVRGQFISACRANVGGTLLALLAIVSGPWTLWVGLWGKWPRAVPGEWTLIWAAVILVMVTLIQWGIRITLN